MKWHFDHGTRSDGLPGERQDPWKPESFAEHFNLVRGSRDASVTSRTVWDWIYKKPPRTPKRGRFDGIQKLLFAGNPNYARWRNELQIAYEREALSGEDAEESGSVISVAVGDGQSVPESVTTATQIPGDDEQVPHTESSESGHEKAADEIEALVAPNTVGSGLVKADHAVDSSSGLLSGEVETLHAPSVVGVAPEFKIELRTDISEHAPDVGFGVTEIPADFRAEAKPKILHAGLAAKRQGLVLLVLSVLAATVVAVVLIFLSAHSHRPFVPASATPASWCTVQANFDDAAKGGILGLQGFIDRCSKEGGALVEKAIQMRARLQSAADASDLEAWDVAVSARLRDLKIPPIQSPCAVRANLEQAEALGVEGLRAFIEECRFDGGVFSGRAKRALAQAEMAAYRSSVDCIKAAKCSTDDLQLCLNGYEQHFSAANLKNELQAAIGAELSSPRCVSPPVPPTPRPRPSQPDPPVPDTGSPIEASPNGAPKASPYKPKPAKCYNDIECVEWNKCMTGSNPSVCGCRPSKC